MHTSPAVKLVNLIILSVRLATQFCFSELDDPLKNDLWQVEYLQHHAMKGQGLKFTPLLF